MTAAQPGWYPDPNRGEGLRWWDGQGWTGHTRNERQAKPDPPRFDTSPGALFQPAASPSSTPPPRPRTSPVVWAAGAAAVIVLLVGILVLTRHGHTTTASSVGGAVAPGLASTTTTLATGSTVTANDSIYADTGGLYTIATGPNWQPGPLGTSGSKTWTVTVDPSTTAKVQVLPERFDSPESVDQLTQSSATNLNGASFGGPYVVDGTGSDQLSDGAPAGVVRVHLNPKDPDNFGANMTGEALVTTKGISGALVIVLCPPANANACLNSVMPYARTVRLTSQ